MSAICNNNRNKGPARRAAILAIGLRFSVTRGLNRIYWTQYRHRYTHIISRTSLIGLNGSVISAKTVLIGKTAGNNFIKSGIGICPSRE